MYIGKILIMFYFGTIADSYFAIVRGKNYPSRLIVLAVVLLCFFLALDLED